MGRFSALLAGSASERDPSHDAAAAKLWSVYVAEAEKYDRALVESWKSDMEGMLIFAGLFSASLTAFIIESYKTLTPDSGNTTVRLLTQISEQLAAATNGSSVVLPLSTPFTPPVTSLVCNAFWFFALGLSLTCALVATLLEQWARDFLHRADMRSAPATRARVFSYLYYGLKRFNMHAVVEIVPLLLHTSLLFFFTGLVAFLIPIHVAVTIIAAALLALLTALYTVLTILPLVSLDCPYRTPLSGVLWNIVSSFTVRDSKSTSGEPSQASQTMVESMLRAATEFSDGRAARDKQALVWTMKSLASDEELEPFIDAIPDVLWGSYSRHHVYDNHIDCLIRAPDTLLMDRLYSFFDNSRRGILDPEQKIRLHKMIYKTLWAILSVYDATDSSKPPPRFYGEDTYFLASADPTVEPYKCSALALLQWHKHWETNTQILEVIEELQRCERDIHMGKVPDVHSISTSLLGHRKFNVIANEMDRYSRSPDMASASQLIPQWLLQIQVRHAGAPLDGLKHYLDRASSLDSPPYRFEETLSSISPKTIIISSATRKSVESTLDQIIYTHMDKFNRLGTDVHWLDNIIYVLFSYWWPEDDPEESIALPRGIVHYLNARNSEGALWQFMERFNDNKCWNCIPKTLLAGPSRPHPHASRAVEDTDRTQTLKALWNML
ncbi:hypothetical protein C8J57DRAFT_1194351, partial [Mycena rebaudengoi]